MKKNRVIVILTSLLIIIVAALFYFLLRSGFQKQNQELYHRVKEKMKQGGNLHLLASDIENFLRRPFLQKDLQNYANILGGYINYRKEDYWEAHRFFSNVKFEGQVFDIQDYVYYWWGKALWKYYEKFRDSKYLKQAASFFKNVIDHPYSPMKRTALKDYLESGYYSGDFSFYDSLPADFLEKNTGIIRTQLPEILYILADANQQMGNREKAIDYLVRLWKKYPYTPWGKKAEEQLEKLLESSRVQYPSLSVTELLDIYDLSYENNKTRDNLNDLVIKLDKIKSFANTKHLKDRINLLYGKLYYDLNDIKKFPGFLSGAYRSSDPGIKAQAAYYLVKDAGNKYNFSKLKSYVSGIDSPRYMKSEYFERTAYAAGFFFMRKKRHKEAVPIYKVVLKKNSPYNQYYQQALWRLHWCYYHLQQYQDALKILEKMGKLSDWEEYAAYWSAYIYQKIGEEETARSIYKDLFTRSGYTYYGILAYERLNRDFGIQIDFQKEKETFAEVQVGTIDDNTRNTRFQILKENGLYEFAANELEAYLKEKNISPGIDRDYWRPYGGELAKLYFYTGKYIRAGLRVYWTYKDYILKGAKNFPPWFWKIYYPLFYKDTIDRYARRYDANREFLYSFIRQESFYEPYAVSPAGAIGVMQIMPETGKEIFKDIGSSLGLREYSVRLLYKPEVNIPMGIYHLKYHLYDKIEIFIKDKGITQADNDGMKTILMIAGYNAGIARPFRWLTEIPFDNMQEFIDQIDISETRDYVKLIQKHRFLYSKYITGEQ
jgi:soluble lytic murein transglycosylase